MALSVDESKRFKQGLATAQKNAASVTAATAAVSASMGLTTELVTLLASVGLPDLFAVPPVNGTNFVARFDDIRNQLGKNRTGRFSAAAETLDTLLTAMKQQPGLNPGTEVFWTRFFQIREKEDEGKVDEFAAEVAASYSVVRLILRSDLERRMRANSLAHVEVDKVAQRLGYRGMSVVADLPKPAYEAIRDARANVVGLLRPGGGPKPEYCIDRGIPGRASLQDLSSTDLDRAITWCDERGAREADAKKALSALRGVVVGGESLASALTAFLLQMVDEQRANGAFPGSIRDGLTGSGLSYDDAARLLNEQTSGSGAYPW